MAEYSPLTVKFEKYEACNVGVRHHLIRATQQVNIFQNVSHSDYDRNSNLSGPSIIGHGLVDISFYFPLKAAKMRDAMSCRFWPMCQSNG